MRFFQYGTPCMYYLQVVKEHIYGALITHINIHITTFGG